MKTFILLVFFNAFVLLNCLKPRDIVDFNNVIQYPTQQDVYKFHLTISPGLSMSTWDDSRKTYNPVIYNNVTREYRMRRFSYSESCDATQPISESDKKSIVTANGIHRHMLLVNQIFPGTPIVVPKNAKVEVTVKNEMISEVLSIHWHGQTQKDTFYMDGVTRITQCPIGPGETFTYKFTATDSGTHWYHAHSGVQRTEGLYGPLIVTDTITKPTRYDEEFHFLVQDWLQFDSQFVFSHVDWENSKFYNGYDKLDKCYTPNRMDDGTHIAPLPLNELDGILINGKGWYNLPNDPSQVEFMKRPSIFDLPIERFTVKPNRRYLFRVIGANAGHPLEIRISGHPMTIVATDGNPIKPIENVQSLIVNSGERYDFEIQTKASNNLNHLIIVRTLESTTFLYQNLTAKRYGVAILRYDGIPETNVTCSDACTDITRSCKKVNCPFWPTDDFSYRCIGVGEFESVSIPDSDKDLLLNRYDPKDFREYFFNFHFSGSIAQRSSVNGHQFVLPPVPPFFYRNHNDSIEVPCAEDCGTTNLTCHCTYIVEIPTNKVIQLVIYNMGRGAGIDGTAHPVHIHGHHFYVVAMGYPTYAPNGTYYQNNKDIDCPTDDDLCNGVGWSDKGWANGNIAAAKYANLADPPKKDTVFVPVGGYIVIRFRSDNVGYWFLHCHIEVHQAEGMSLVIKEGTDAEINKKVDYKSLNTCGYGTKLNGVSAFKSSFTSVLILSILIKLFF